MAGSTERRNLWLARAAIAVYVAIGFVPYFVSGLVVPPGAVAVLIACWAAGLVVTVWRARDRPAWAIAAVILALLFWFAFVSLGSAIFGWAP